VALRTRIKMFYRPRGLPGSPLDAGGQLQWTLARQAGRRHVQVHNPTPFHVSFIGIKVVAERREDEIYAPVMVAPFASRSYPLASQDWVPDTVVFSTINDHGGYSTPLRRPLSGTH
jgi:chaperone protein EcpD